MGARRTPDVQPSECYALQCLAPGTCVLYVDVYGDGTLAALHGRPGELHPTHAQRWTPALTRTRRRTALLAQFLRYIHPELAADPRELPVFAIAPVTANPPLPWLEARSN